nr:HAD hydrolase family protein [Companilactobacillus metriopterae]
MNYIKKTFTDKLSKKSLNYADNLGIEIYKKDLSKIIQLPNSILFIDNKQNLEEILNKMNSRFSNTYSHVLIPWKENYWFLQFLPQSTSKGDTLFEWAEYNNISKKEILSFGDSYNDLEMISGSGVGVAMENAEQKIKEVADYVTSSNDELGVSNFINKILN